MFGLVTNATVYVNFMFKSANVLRLGLDLWSKAVLDHMIQDRIGPYDPGPYWTI